jgi:hypothetical protein
VKKLHSRIAALHLVLAAVLAVSLRSLSLAADHAGYLYTYALDDARYDDAIVSISVRYTYDPTQGIATRTSSKPPTRGGRGE